MSAPLSGPLTFNEVVVALVVASMRLASVPASVVVTVTVSANEIWQTLAKKAAARNFGVEIFILFWF